MTFGSNTSDMFTLQSKVSLQTGELSESLYRCSNYLWELCERYDLRFIVIDDRYDIKY